jgi:hypothetical protein
MLSLDGRRMQVPQREAIAPHRAALEWHAGRFVRVSGVKRDLAGFCLMVRLRGLKVDAIRQAKRTGRWKPARSWHADDAAARSAIGPPRVLFASIRVNCPCPRRGGPHGAWRETSGRRATAAIHSQSSRRRPGTRENSAVLCVTKVSSRARAMAAIIKSFGPMGMPRRANPARRRP